MYCIETLDCVLGTKDDFIIQDTELKQVKKIFNKPNKLVTIPLRYTRHTQLQENLLPAPLHDTINNYNIIKHNFIELAYIESQHQTHNLLEYDTTLTEQTLNNIKEYLAQFNIETINNQYLKALPQSILSLIIFSRKLKTYLRTQQSFTNINIQYRTYNKETFIYAIFGDTAVLYFTNTKSAYTYLQSLPNIKHIYCGTINKDTEKFNLTATIKPDTYKTLPIGILTHKPKGFLKNITKDIQPLTTEQYYQLGLNDNLKYLPISLSYQKALDVISYYGWDITKMLVQIKTPKHILIVEHLSNTLLNYFYSTQPDQTTISKYNHYSFTEIPLTHIEYSKHKYYQPTFTKDYQINFEGSDGKKNRKIRNRFETLINNKEINLIITRDPTIIKSKLQETNNFIKQWFNTTIKDREKTNDSFILGTYLSTFIPYISNETLSLLNLTGIYVYNKQNQLIGFSLGYKPYKDLVELNQGATLNTKEHSDLQKYLHFIKIETWHKLGKCDIVRGITNIERIVEYNLQLKANLFDKLAYIRAR